MILNRELSGEITSIPPNKFADCGNRIVVQIAIRIPAAAITAGKVRARSFVNPMVSTASATKTMIASGDASLSKSR